MKRFEVCSFSGAIATSSIRQYTVSHEKTVGVVNDVTDSVICHVTNLFFEDESDFMHLALVIMKLLHQG